VPGVGFCVFGGANEKMTCGAILQFGVSINVPKPKTKGRESVRFYHVVKVQMIDDYDKGYLGAPVYIAARIPFATEIIAAPVGQVVETTVQYKGFQKNSKI